MSTDVMEAPAMTEEKPKTLSVKLHVDVIESARIVSAYRNETMTDLLSALLRPALAKLEREEVAKRTGDKPRGRGAK
jgi:hypothetical protein